MSEKGQGRHLAYGIASLCLYAACVVAYAVWANHERVTQFQGEIDRRLLMAARGLKYMLAPDFHDRAVDAGSIPFDEELRNRRAVNGFCRDADFKWIYTLVEKDGRFFFAAPTVSEEEARQRRSWYFYPYEDIPREFVEAYASGKVAYVNYSDRWGTFRSVAVPETSPGKRRYLACADYEMSRIAAIERATLVESALTAVFFFLCSLPFVFVSWRFFGQTAARLRVMNEEIARHRDRLEELVHVRTMELEEANERLKHELGERKRAEESLSVQKRELEDALAQVRVLSGLIPICSSCKKIRDDKGYWNQIERYIQEHSDAQFSHSICPECLRRLYPDIKT
ncbi:MAG TPA: hypothetical protein PLS81_07935 [Deltaproteobacteria bacterium]|nr:hypothetical protein [Deltaproteobacteria bacterium]HPP80342.1 hypothetical protein [Deltaproteobacteria bacterium]